MNFKVYKLTTPSNKVYIGITCQSLNKRWQNGKGYKRCPAIRKAINKYGWNNIQKEVLYDDLQADEAKALEIKLITEYHSNDKQFGYNLTDGGDGTLGRRFTDEQKKALSEKHKGKIISVEQRQKLREANLGKHHSEETKRKISQSHMGNTYNLGKKLSEERKIQIGEREKGANNPRARKVICLETLKVYDTITQAKEDTGANKICSCCRHEYKHKSSAGLHWEYYNERLTDDDYREILQKLIKEEYENKHMIPSEENIQKTVERSSKAVICVETGEVFKSAKDACKKYNLNPSSVCSCCKGKQLTTKGLHWRYYKETFKCQK